MVQAFKSKRAAGKMLRVREFARKKNIQVHKSVLNVKTFVPMINIINGITYHKYNLYSSICSYSEMKQL